MCNRTGKMLREFIVFQITAAVHQYSSPLQPAAENKREYSAYILIHTGRTINDVVFWELWLRQLALIFEIS